jgi:IS30 family transposase
MRPKLGEEARMTVKELSRRGWTKTQIAGTLEVTEGTVRYHDAQRERRELCGILASTYTVRQAFAARRPGLRLPADEVPSLSFTVGLRQAIR